MKNAGTLILENSLGQVVRTYHWHEGSVVVYLNHETDRLELATSAAALKKVDFDYTILSEANVKQLNEGIEIPGRRGHLRLAKEDLEDFAPQVQFDVESDEEIKAIGKWTTVSHAILALLLVVTSFIISKLRPNEAQVVTVFQQDLTTAKVVQTVKAAEHKIERTQIKAKVAERTVKPKVSNRVVSKRHSQIRTQVSLSQVGALGALGGMKNGLKGSAGFNVNATNASLGTSMTEIGKGGVGGFERGVHGAGLITAPVGSGGFSGTGGYATRGKGGGRPGYGSMSMVGGSSGYFLPLEEEALVEGGLDKDQIAAVIQRNLGQVIYCYEKGLQVQPSLKGRVGVRFVIGSSGQVSTAGIEQSSLKSSSVEGCILNKLRGWRFPKPYGGVNVKVSYPFLLRRVG